MAYIVNNSRGQIIAVIQDGTINTTATTQTLVGKNYTPYGEFVVENTVKQLENFANSVPPINPIEGQLWYNTAEEVLYAYSGEEWKTVSGMTVSTTEPSLDPRFGDLWFNPDTQQVEVYSPTDVGQGWIPVSKVTVSSVQPVGQITGELYYNTFGDQLYVFDGGTWKLIGPEGVPGFPTTRWVSDTILDTSSVAHAVVRGIANGATVAIMTSETFTILASQRPTGFVDLVPGINLSSQSLFAGVATSTQKLATPRAINGVLFDGTANITIPDAGSLTAGAYLLGTTYTGQFPETWNVDAAANNVGNKVVVRDNSGNFAASTITANLIGNVSGTATNVTGVVAVANGGTGLSSYTPGNILIGNGSSLTSAPLTGAGPITVTSTGNSVTIGYTGGLGNGTVTSVGIAAGEGIGVSNSPITESGNITVTNTGVTRVNSGEGIAVDRTNGNVTFTNTGVTQIIPGPGVTVNRGNGAVTVSVPDGSITSVELAGSVKLWSGSAAPQDWVIADGRALSRTEYATLFSRIGTIFGAGNGSTTFNIPNLLGRTAVGANAQYPLGSTGGSADAVVVSHTHAVNDPGHRHDTNISRDNISGQTLLSFGQQQFDNSLMIRTSIATTGVTINNAGESGVGKNLPPYQAVYYIVKLNDAPNTAGGGGGVIISDDTVASIKMWGGSLEPLNWMFCDGRALSRAAYPELFTAIGVTFGSGDGSTTFNIPNMTNRFAVGAGGVYAAGTTGGSADAVVVAHQHDEMFWNTPERPFVQSNGAGPTELGLYPAQAAPPGNFNVVRTRSAGESGTNKNLPPYLSTRFIIKVSTGAQSLLPISLGGTSANNQSDAINNLLPSQSTNQGRFLTTNGSTVSWAQVDPGLPVQTGQLNNFLTTNGTTASWAGVLGVGQVWQNVASQRALGVTYTNSTGRPIMVAVTLITATGAFSYAMPSVFVNNLQIVRNSGTAAGTPMSGGVTFVVPPGATYRVTRAGGTENIQFWTELR